MACTQERCDDLTGACFSFPDDSRCDAPSACDPMVGCVSRCEGSLECDPVVGCGCAPSEGCYTQADGPLVCVDAGALPHGAVCLGDVVGGGCEAGALCVSALGSTLTHCRDACGEDADCPPGSRCGAAVSTSGLRVCTLGCDLYANTDCPDGLGCHLLTLADRTRVTDCALAGPTDRNAPCSAGTGECREGLLCTLNSATMGFCRGLCRRGRSSDCRSGERCLRFDEPFLVDGEEVGPCVP